MSDIMHVNIQFYIVKPLKVQGSTSGFLTDALNLFEQQLPADVEKLFRIAEGILDVVRKKNFEVWSL